MYLNEQRLNDALFPFLATALFGAERTGYWRACLESAAEPERAAPARERAEEIEAEIADLDRRLTRQLVNLEADDVTSACVGAWVNVWPKLEDAIAERRERLVELARDSATEAPKLADVAPLLDRLPLLAYSLDTAPQGELRALFDALQLDVIFQPGDSALDVAVTLYDHGSEIAHVRRTGSCGGLVGAPGRIRTFAHGFRKPMLFPLSYGGVTNTNMEVGCHTALCHSH